MPSMSPLIPAATKPSCLSKATRALAEAACGLGEARTSGRAGLSFCGLVMSPAGCGPRPGHSGWAKAPQPCVCLDSQPPALLSWAAGGYPSHQARALALSHVPGARSLSDLPGASHSPGAQREGRPGWPSLEQAAGTRVSASCRGPFRGQWGWRQEGGTGGGERGQRLAAGHLFLPVPAPSAALGCRPTRELASLGPMPLAQPLSATVGPHDGTASRRE
ncbi:hypothetical protein H1C71_006209 [Ictidomys tridecemlineatus]|nr:hypothetical protein H1C71_006209 [Ictidomys tridecemlineatus]